MEKRKQAWLIIFGSVLFLGALLFGKTIITPKPVCDPSIKSKTVILLDHSEGVPTQTMNEIVDRAWEMIDKEVPEGELVSVFSLDKLSKRDFKPSFSACKPRIDGSRTTEDIRRIRRDFEDKFKKPLMTALAAPISGADESAIAQALIDLSLDDVRFRSNDVTRLSIFSDFLENTPGFSMYKCTNPAGAVSQFLESRL